MGKVVLDATLNARLNGMREAIEFRDENGVLVGHFLPAELYRNLVYIAAAAACPFSPEELERRRQETGGRSLAEIWTSWEQS
jgi:hypothetical protein